MTSQKGTKPPKEIWVPIGTRVVFESRDEVLDSAAHYILAPAPKPEPREAVAWIIKKGDMYLYSYASKVWDHRLPVAERWLTRVGAESAADDLGDGARIVKLVRKRGTP